jgi:uncharacterized protein (DUF2235 family)
MMARTDCKPWFIGVWDTVNSAGWIANPLEPPYVTTNLDIEIGRHAVAIDERRAFFRDHLWRRPNEYVKQVWFPGVHCDAGGCYPDPQGELAKGAREWMLEEASRAMDQQVIFSGPGRFSKLRNACSSIWV